MKSPAWQIAVFGTFDVENYGDLLFPLIAEAELTERLGPINLRRFSYHAKTPPQWPYSVESISDLPKLADSLDAVLIGGGFLVRFDKEVAPNYAPPTPTIHHPTGYWLTPALIALQHRVRVIWNSPGMHCNDIPTWAAPLLELALGHSSYIAVRDEPTRQSLQKYAGTTRVRVVPDTGFGISRLVNDRSASRELRELLAATGLNDRKYVIIQPAPSLTPFVKFLKSHSERLKDISFLTLPISPALDDRTSIVTDELPGVAALPSWPHPLLLAELISHAAAVAGQSYHLTITAIAFGVPVFSSSDFTRGKFTALSAFEAIYALPSESEADAELFIKRLGKTTPSPKTDAALDALSQHWDLVAQVVDRGREPGQTQTKEGTQEAFDRFWQALPSMLEGAARVETLEDRLATLFDSPSWKFTAPMRSVMRGLKRLRNK